MTDSAMQKHLYDHKHELRDLEDCLSHIVVICLIFYLFTACTYFFALFLHCSVQSSYCCSTK